MYKVTDNTLPRLGRARKARGQVHSIVNCAHVASTEPSWREQFSSSECDADVTPADGLNTVQVSLPFVRHRFTNHQERSRAVKRVVNVVGWVVGNTEESNHRIPQELVQHTSVVDNLVTRFRAKRRQTFLNSAVTGRISHISGESTKVCKDNRYLTVSAGRQYRTLVSSCRLEELSQTPITKMPKKRSVKRRVVIGAAEGVDTLCSIDHDTHVQQSVVFQ